MENEEPTVYQYYTIVSEPDTFITGHDEGDLTYIENTEAPNKVMYLSLEQEEEEAYAPNVVLNGACEEEEEDEDEIAVANIKFITMEDGQMYMTDSTNLDDDYKLDGVDNELMDCDNEDISVLAEEQVAKDLPSSSDNETEFPEGDYRKIKLEDGTCAYIDKSLWHSLIDNIDAADGDQSSLPLKKEKKYPCAYYGCNKVYTTAHHLSVHTRNHTGSRPYQCPTAGCDKAFATGYSLKAHLRTHTGESPYSCIACPKQFKTSGDLQKHVRTHTGEKPFKCPIEGCGRSFTTSNIRKVHIRSHTGERPYACTYKGCGKAFASATNFKNHMRIHSGEKPYQCTVPNCGKRFTEYSSLFKHNTVHKPFKPLKCDYCDQMCKHETTLKAHKQAMHKVLITEDGREIRLKDEDTCKFIMPRQAH